MKKTQILRCVVQSSFYNSEVMIPKTIGRYRIKAELGRGGMSTVYLAHDPHFERDVAIKLLPLELLHQTTFRRRFEREAKIVAALDHPAIVPVYDFGEEAKQPFLVMRFMTGGSLTDRLKQGRLTLQEAARIIARLAPALDEVHSHGVVHRDLKPSNVLFDQRNEPYISDFGTAKLLEEHTKLTNTGGAVGTPAYMSPEQIQGEGKIDGRSDIYTLGIILFEMLSGKHPFSTNTPIAVAVKHMFEPVPRILDLEPDLPPGCQAILTKSMAKQRTDRYGTAIEFADALSRAAGLVPAGTLPASEPVRQQRKQPLGRRLALIISNSEYSDPTLAQLIKPSANIELLVKVLHDPKIGRFDEVTPLINEPADVIRRTISHFYADKQREDVLLLYYMGHAALDPHGRLFLTVTNTEHEFLRGTAIPARFIADEMDNSESQKQILILDCDYSETQAEEVPGLIGRTVNTGETFTRNGHKRIVLTANDSTQYNWGKEMVLGEATPSSFTHHFVQGLKDGTADTNCDGKVTIDELFAYIQTQLTAEADKEKTPTQVPRKWAPYAYQEECDIVVAHNPTWAGESQIISGVKVKDDTKPSRFPRQLKWKPLLGTAVMVTLLLLLFTGASSFFDPESNQAALATSTPTIKTTTMPENRPENRLENTAVPAIVSQPTGTTPPTATATTEPTASPTPSPTMTPTLTPSMTPTLTPTAPITETYVTALLSSSIFAQPDGNAPELTFVGAGEQVLVLGRSENGEWLYVRDEEGTEGFVYGPRTDWAGEYANLPVKTAVSTNRPTNCSGGGCSPLTLDIYPLPGTRCGADLAYRTVYIRGQGGNGRYTYYWNGDIIAGPIADSTSFEVSSHGAAIIGTGKVVSGDGQTIEQEIFISDFDCE